MLEGLNVIFPRIYRDDRGWLSEIFRKDELPDYLDIQMGSVSVTKPGVVRGPHEHLSQTDFFCFPGIGRFDLYLWDNDSKSKTYGKTQMITAEEDKPLILVVAPRIVHAYKNTGTFPGMVFNFPNKLYGGINKSSEVDEIRHETIADSKFNIKNFSLI